MTNDFTASQEAWKLLLGLAETGQAAQERKGG